MGETADMKVFAIDGVGRSVNGHGVVVWWGIHASWHASPLSPLRCGLAILDRWERGSKLQPAFSLHSQYAILDGCLKQETESIHQTDRKAYIKRSSAHEHLFAHSRNDMLPYNSPLITGC